MKEELCSSCDIIKLNNSFEGILWLKLKQKDGPQEILCYVCFLPPAESTRELDSSEFCDTLTYQIHMYCKGSLFFLCGDFNARVSNLEDFIPGIGKIPERHVIDFKCKK